MTKSRLRHAETCLVLLVFSVFIFSTEAPANGQLLNLGGIAGLATLTYAAGKRFQINYCIEVDAASLKDFPDASIDEQARMGISLWLEVFESYIHHKVAVVRVACSDPYIDLKIIVASQQLVGNGEAVMARTRYYSGSKKPYARIDVDTSYKYSGDESIFDFSDIVRNKTPRIGLQEAMSEAKLRKMRSNDVGMWVNADVDAVRFSTYPNLIHELGHAFGLCDTNDRDFVGSCDMHFVSSQTTQDDSVMKSANYFYLTDDDMKGVQALVDRFVATK